MVCRLMPALHASSSDPGGQAVMERQQLRAPYPSGRVIVLDDDHNTFQHVVEGVMPGMWRTSTSTTC